MDNISLPRPFVEELYRYFYELPMSQSEFVVLELRRALNPPPTQVVDERPNKAERLGLVEPPVQKSE